MKRTPHLITMLFCGIFVTGCSLNGDYPRLVDVPSAPREATSMEEKRRIAEEMAQGTSADELPDVLLNSPQFKTDFLDRMDRRGWEESEMWILLRRVATYTETGR